ncbi:GNAT family N-acetyltransferase [bacterium]|nr:GNAT family N-acetyltransferase [bacterium]
MQIRTLEPKADRAAVAALLAEAEDYYRLCLGHAPGPAEVDEVYLAGPPGCDSAQSCRLGLWLEDRLSGVAELSFGFPAPGDAYLGLMILAPRVRGRGHGAAFYAQAEHLARQRHCPQIFLAVLEANPRGLAFWQAQGFAATGVMRLDAATGHRIHRLRKGLD